LIRTGQEWDKRAAKCSPGARRSGLGERRRTRPRCRRNRAEVAALRCFFQRREERDAVGGRADSGRRLRLLHLRLLFRRLDYRQSCGGPTGRLRGAAARRTFQPFGHCLPAGWRNRAALHGAAGTGAGMRRRAGVTNRDAAAARGRTWGCERHAGQHPHDSQRCSQRLSPESFHLSHSLTTPACRPVPRCAHLWKDQSRLFLSG